MKPSASIRVALIGKTRKIYLPQKKLPSKPLLPGESFSDAASRLEKAPLMLLGVYSDPVLFKKSAGHEFVVAFIGISDAEGPDWYGEGDIPKDVVPSDLRILYDALCFIGTPFAR